MSVLSVSVLGIPHTILLARFTVESPPHVENRTVFESIAPGVLFKVGSVVPGGSSSARILWEPVAESWGRGTSSSKLVAGSHPAVA